MWTNLWRVFPKNEVFDGVEVGGWPAACVRKYTAGRLERLIVIISCYEETIPLQAMVESERT